VSTSAITRDRIIHAAETVFADKGYHDTLVDEVVSATNLSKGGVYFHFPSKEPLFFAVLDRLASRLVSSAEDATGNHSSPIAKANAALISVLANLSKHKRLAKLLMLQGYSMGNSFEHKRIEIFERFSGVIERHLRHAIDSGEVNDADPAVAARIWLGALNELVIHWLYSGGAAPVASQQLLRRVLIGGLTDSNSHVLGTR